MSGLNITRPVYQIRSVAGVARAGWKLRFFLINSDEESEVFEDIGRTVVACQPVILNSEGWANVYAGDNDYTVREYDADDVLKNCFDMQGASGGGSSGTFSIVPTVQAMRELVAGSSTYVVAQGYDEYGDACGGEFDWIPDAANPDDGVTWFAPVSFPAEGRYRRRNATALTMRMAGDPGNLDSSYETITRMAAAAQPGDNVVFPPGIYKLAASESPEFEFGIAVSAESGAKIDTADASSIVFNGTFTAPVTEVFTGELNVSFGSVQPLAFPEWYGAHADSGETDNTDAFLALFASGALLYTLPGQNNYAVETDITASIPGNAVFILASKVYYTIGPVDLIAQGLYSPNGKVDFASIKAAIGTFTNLTVDDSIDVAGNINLAGSLLLDLNVIAGGFIQAPIIQGDDVGSYGPVTAGTTVSAGTTVAAGGNVTAGNTGAGVLRARAGTGSMFLRAGGRLWCKTIATSSVGAAPTTLATKFIVANTLTQVGDCLNIKLTVAFAATADNKTFVFNLTEGFQTITVTCGPSFAPSARVMHFYAKLLRTSSTVVLFTYNTLVYDNGVSTGQLYGAYPGDSFNSGDSAPTDPHSHSVTVPAQRIDSMSTSHSEGTLFSSALGITFSCVGTGVTNGDVSLLDADIYFDPVPESVN